MFVMWQDVDVCLLCGKCFVCYDVKRVCHKVNVFIWHEVKFPDFFLFSCFEWVIERSPLLPWGAGMFVIRCMFAMWRMFCL